MTHEAIEFHVEDGIAFLSRQRGDLQAQERRRGHWWRLRNYPSDEDHASSPDGTPSTEAPNT
jgi:hypothetical protein